jgi:hypothetical protein
MRRPVRRTESRQAFFLRRCTGPTGAVGGTGPDWWLPGIYETSLYDFPGAMGLLLNTLVLTAHMTGDATYLEPLRTMAEARRAWLQAGRPQATARDPVVVRGEPRTARGRRCQSPVFCRQSRVG